MANLWIVARSGPHPPTPGDRASSCSAKGVGMRFDDVAPSRLLPRQGTKKRVAGWSSNAGYVAGEKGDYERYQIKTTMSFLRVSWLKKT